MQKIRIARNKNEYTLTELLDDKSLEAINKVSRILSGVYYIRSGQLSTSDKVTSYFRKLMNQKTGVR